MTQKSIESIKGNPSAAAKKRCEKDSVVHKATEISNGLFPLRNRRPSAKAKGSKQEPKRREKTALCMNEEIEIPNVISLEMLRLKRPEKKEARGPNPKRLEQK